MKDNGLPILILIQRSIDIQYGPLKGWTTTKQGTVFGAFSFVPLSEFVGRPSWTKSG